MNKIRLFASVRNNGSAQSGLARVSAAFVVLIGIVLLVMSGCAGDVTVQVPVPVPAEPTPADKPDPDPNFGPVSGSLVVLVEVSAGTVMQNESVTLSATVQNTTNDPSKGSALLAFYKSTDPLITPDLTGAEFSANILPQVLLAMEESMHSPLGIDPVFTTTVLEQLAANQNTVGGSASNSVVAGTGLDPIIDTALVAPLAARASEIKTISIPSTADAGSFYYGACIVASTFHCSSVELSVTLRPVPDLRPVSVPTFNQATYRTNATATISAQVRNYGGAASSDGQVEFFREAGGSDVSVGTASLGTLAADAGASGAATVSATFMTAVPVGIQEYYAVISGVTDETNTSNGISGLGSITVANTNAIDIDADNLIDVNNLDMLNNIRHNLAGTSYKTSAGAPDMRCGSSGTASCQGYELMRDLDFAQAGSYQSNTVNTDWRPNNAIPAQATNPGWSPIGRLTSTIPSFYYGHLRDQFSSAGTFTAILEGNEHTIRNLYIRNSDNLQGVAIGLFSIVTGTVRNLDIVDIAIYGGQHADYLGTIAGYVSGNGAIINVSARRGIINGGESNDSHLYTVFGAEHRLAGAHWPLYSNFSGGTVGWDTVGGLVGVNAGTIAASYSAITVLGGGGSDLNIGALVGTALGPVIASYSIGSAFGDDGPTAPSPGAEIVGALVGQASSGRGTLNATYALGNANSGGRSTVSTESVGGLVGQRLVRDSHVITISASYYTGTVHSGAKEHNTGSSNRCVGTIGGMSYAVDTGNRPSLTGDNYSFGKSTATYTPWRPPHNPPYFPSVASWCGTDSGNPLPNNVTIPDQLTAANSGWGDAANGAWVFNSAYSAPALKYTDYDGAGGIDYCAQLPDGACSGNRLLPHQPVTDQGGNSATAYVVDAFVSPGTGFGIPAKITAGDVDYFQITVVQAGTLEIESTGDIDSQGTLYSNSGVMMEHNDEGGIGSNFKISRAVPRGIYYIRASSFFTWTGSYILRVGMTK